ncbi:MAG: M23 family metallopeptidase [Spirochaeta sp.]
MKQLEADADELLGPGISDASALPRKTRGRLPMIKIIISLCMFWVILPPVYYPVHGVWTSGFALRMRPESIFWTDLEIHKGIDIGAPVGTPIHSLRKAVTGF